ncbi:hypothetical protein QFW96_14605 [Saccharopolyspora sp. TS4A08]|uniref:TRAP transporter small permease subunit n=1 Tax=Saccharopolyspora ipomoeae TaxID=3042027 RepID=A0ABT6PPJ2_9PSEU|nr:hypothetical protein [Saccharopolyspora sp. TS4A08]MDI2029859.1 hypothetical protein [Saccharopolyspora sp. TS4A08]
MLGLQAVGYLEAWSLWWSGAEVKGFAMWSLPVLWWARIGKLLQFAGGAVVIIDLVGPERFKQLSNRMGRSKHRLDLRVRLLLHFAVMCVIAGLIMFAIVADFVRRALSYEVAASYDAAASLWLSLAFVPILIAANQAHRVVSGFSKIVALGQHGNAWKWVSFVLIVVGFQFDLLGS